jgi:hypothetical protein
MSETERSENAKRRRRRRGRREVSERAVRDPGDLTPKPVLGDVPTTTTKAQWKDTFGDATPAPDPKPPTDDVDGPRSAKAVIDESNKIVADAVGLGGLGGTPQRMADKLPGRDLAGTAVRATDPKHPTADADPPYVRSAKAVIDENNKIVKDAVGDVEGVGGGTSPRSMVAPATQFGDVGYGTQATADPAAARRPFVLGTPHHAAGAAAMAGADPTALAAATGGAAGSGQADEATINAAILDASLAQVETAIRVMKRDLESLEEYYRELAAHRDELDLDGEDAERGEEGNDEAEMEAERE